MKRKKNDRQPDADLPKEITMTDLEAAEEEARRHGSADHQADIHAAGTPMGGTASGGLAGTNVGRGDPDDVDLENALGSGIHDTGADDESDQPHADRVF
jgi:hypothetical protein